MNWVLEWSSKPKGTEMKKQTPKKVTYLDEQGDGVRYKVVQTQIGKTTVARLYSFGSSWNSIFQNKKLVTIFERGCQYKIIVHSNPKKVLSVDLSELAEIRALVEVMNRTSGAGIFTKLKILGL